METIKLLHRLDTDEQIIELRDYITILAYECDVALQEERSMSLELRPVIILTVLMMMELGEWGPDSTPVDEILEEYQALIVETIGDKMTPALRDAMDRVVSTLSDMVEANWAPIKRDEVDAMVDDRVPYSDTVLYTVIKYDLDINSITYVMTIVPELLEEPVQMH